ncbi:MAG: SusC/RagA family TonB-linked outer membrane protein [Prevotella sp.]|jgi:TonB-linked SusC/RagA family outer membrane protein|nr:SusC/RagA family TonB-linked outer membrane protein [Prevotella sp.]
MAQENKKEAEDPELHVEIKGRNRSVLMGEQDPSTMLQSVSSVSGDRLLHRPVFQMESFLDGTLPGLVTDMSQGYPTSQLSLKLRGRGLMIVVDGIPRSDANIPASQIESVSVIKDGLGLSMMGMSSGNGILYIKTKRGNRTSMKIGFTAQLAFNKQIFRPEFLGAYDYSVLLNEALVNDGKAPMYSRRDLDLFGSGASPYTHPDIDWYDEIMRETAPVWQYNLNMSGGGKTARYFVDINVYDQSGFLKQDKTLNSYDTQESFKKYSLRTNTDVSLGPSTLMKVNVFGQMFRETTPGSMVMGSVYKALHTTPNNAYPVLNPNGTISGNAIYKNNLYAQTVHSGYYMYPKTDFNIDVSLEHKFTEKLKGLYAGATYSYNSSYREELNRSKGFDVYSYWKDPDDKSPDTDANYVKLVTPNIAKNASDYSRLNRLQYLEFAAGYDFGINKHSSKNKVLYSYNDYLIKGTALPLSKNTLSFRSEYNYDKRYLAEVAFSTMSLNQLKPGEQWGWFPAAGIGWNMARENWFSEAAPAVGMLKLRATYGVNGSDGTGSYYRSATGTLSDYYYTYLKYYKKGTGVNLGGTSASQSTLVEANLPYLTKWEKIKRLTIGADVEAFDGTLAATVEFFNNNYSDILQKSVGKDNSGLVGIDIPKENIGEYRQTGLELDVNYNNKFGDFTVYANANATFYKTKLLANGELEYPESYMQRVGKPYGQIFGYVADGFFQSRQEIDKYLETTKIEGYLPVPGDLKYKDLNNDGVIDGKDIKDIGTKSPRIEYGIYLGAEWKGIGLSMQWSGIANSSVVLRDTPFGINAEGGYGQALEEHLDRWTPDNPDAGYPRLSAVENTYNERTSSFWVKDGAYLRLKNVELSYTLPHKWISAIRLSGLKVFANGYNLLTVSGIKDKDPELLNFMSSDGNTGIVPNAKAFNFGLNIQF